MQNDASAASTWRIEKQSCWEDALQRLIGSLEKRIKLQHPTNPASKRLETIPGIGNIGATVIAATVIDPTVFRSGRDFAAWIGLVPREESSGGKRKLGSISKRGDRYLRCLLVVGAHSVLRVAKRKPDTTLQGRGDSTRQQDGARGLGLVNLWRHVSNAPRQDRMDGFVDGGAKMHKIEDAGRKRLFSEENTSCTLRFINFLRPAVFDLPRLDVKIVRELTRSASGNSRQAEMQIAKIILALLVSFSVAIVPAAGGAYGARRSFGD